ncbi:hypothetical protein TcasGA2_TC001241 [Tribolium castaneum]|uniref:Telomeric repeat-binding factor 2-interacting protein 1 n=1 Tax=Tribolium castaneum TaxID=7070 RepID=D6WAY9_TRICA|nr:PREDICTED: uncharacterized protein LOC103315261 [Tribolium castaneum]XP_008201726.1 PREDICTED: uncharacterized protein LOC103315261 [Tribolium castaneum]XP_015840554.1 PREDICTED: uncharacterized protein LOC103315261 [Tribolium castaneum]EEZ98702.1 hypothetical protein TcasGA2_TC001241 [Tribolium castaneum]|eukprot:XP_008201725.1 PREDICTED: uncharacterized protein LOC103315261 [Tribolium castaneum]
MSLYSQDEEKKIVDYIVANNDFYRIKGDKLWQEMAEAQVVNRSWHSLKQHFRKRIVHELHYPRYELDQKTVELFREHFYRIPTKGDTVRRETAGNLPFYSEAEEKKIVDYIVEHHYFGRIKGDKLWKEIAEAKVVDRSWQGLKQHFRKKIINELHKPRYGLDEKTIQLFRNACHGTTKTPVATTTGRSEEFDIAQYSPPDSDDD